MTDKDETFEVLQRAIQAVVDVLPPGYRMALAVVHQSGRASYGLSPGLTHEDAERVFGDGAVSGTQQTRHFNKRM